LVLRLEVPLPKSLYSNSRTVVATAGGVDGHPGTGGPAAHHDHVPHAGMRAQAAVHLGSGHDLSLQARNTIQPRMNTDKLRLERFVLSVFIRVHLWPES
jgi:hypothetical protein